MYINVYIYIYIKPRHPPTLSHTPAHTLSHAPFHTLSTKRTPPTHTQPQRAVNPRPLVLDPPP